MPISGNEERELRINVMRADLDRKANPGFWKIPRDISILLGGVTAIAGGLRLKIGQNGSPAQINF